MKERGTRRSRTPPCLLTHMLVPRTRTCPEKTCFDKIRSVGPFACSFFPFSGILSFWIPCVSAMQSSNKQKIAHYFLPFVSRLRAIIWSQYSVGEAVFRYYSRPIKAAVPNPHWTFSAKTQSLSRQLGLIVDR